MLLRPTQKAECDRRTYAVRLPYDRPHSSYHSAVTASDNSDGDGTCLHVETTLPLVQQLVHPPSLPSNGHLHLVVSSSSATIVIGRHHFDSGVETTDARHATAGRRRRISRLYWMQLRQPQHAPPASLPLPTFGNLHCSSSSCDNGSINTISCRDRPPGRCLPNAR